MALSPIPAEGNGGSMCSGRYLRPIVCTDPHMPRYIAAAEAWRRLAQNKEGGASLTAAWGLPEAWGTSAEAWGNKGLGIPGSVTSSSHAMFVPDTVDVATRARKRVCARAHGVASALNTLVKLTHCGACSLLDPYLVLGEGQGIGGTATDSDRALLPRCKQVCRWSGVETARE